MALQEKLLGQARENSTNAVSVYALPADTTAIIKTIVLCNTTGVAATVRVFVDNDGTTYDQSTALLYDVSIAANETLTLDSFMAMSTASGHLAYRTGTANAITISVFGAEIT